MRSSLGWSLALVVLGGVACERGAPREEPELGQNEPSPNARILPAPLRSAQSRAATEKASGIERVPWPVERALGDEDAPSPSPAGGLEFSVDFALPEVRATDELREQAPRAHASLRVQLLPSVSDVSGSRPARQRVVLDGALFVLPEGSELRSRGDRIGWLVVWPDGRSYRVVPEGALQSLFEERRVDVMPTFGLELRAVERVTRGDRELSRRRLSNPVGELELLVEPLPELGDAALLFCDMVLGLLRAQRTEAACAAGELPVEMRWVWAQGGELRASVGSLKRRSDPSSVALSTPPYMSIWKPGELPPDVERPWPARTLRELEVVGGNLAVTFENGWDVPMLLFWDGVPLARLEPQGELTLAPTRGVGHYQARDFLGQRVRAPAPLQLSARYRLGADPELRPEPSASGVDALETPR